MPYPLGCPGAHGPVSAHSQKGDGPSQRAPGSLARVIPATGWNLTDFIDRTRPVTAYLRSARFPHRSTATVCRCLSFFYSTFGRRYSFPGPKVLFIVLHNPRPISPQGVRRAPHWRQQVTPEHLALALRGSRVERAGTNTDRASLRLDDDKRWKDFQWTT
jgi:hypothetical protein